MQFDDPLADLSDGSNDSFFDEPKPSSKRASLTKTPEKKSITDIFNITEKPIESNLAPPKKDDWLGLDSKETKSPKPFTKKISFEDDDDLLGNLGLSKKGPKEEEKGKKIDLLESILGTGKSEEEKPKDVLKESKGKSPGSVASTPKPSTESFFSEGPREGRRGRRSSGGLIDPLGLFSEAKSEEKVKPPKPALSKSAPNISDSSGLPDWLGGGASTPTPIKPSKSETVLHQPKEAPPEPPKQPEIAPIETKDDQLLLTQQKLAQSHIEYQNTSIALQQQESQLLMALQLKKYEENMSEMQMKQQEVLMKQEQQFNLLLERQFAKQQIMENNMRLQQERINNHIQMLISQPPIGKTSNEEKEKEDEDAKLIDSLKQRQHEEVFLLEESYKKQISLLEQNLEAVEKRLRSEVENQSEMFTEKLKVLQEQHQAEIDKYKLKIQEIELEHSEELKKIRESNSRMIDEIKYEHSTLVESMKEAKKSETSLFQETSSYAQKLDANIDFLSSNSRSLSELRERLESDYGVLSKAREESLKAKEKEISMMRETLEKCREAAEKERAELLGLVRTLETKIAEQNQNSREERWTFQQAASTLAARSAAMDREAEFNRASLEREREQLKTLKGSILAEQEKMMLQLTEEKLALSAEKSKIEASSKLNSYDSQRARTEIDAAIQIAKEAAELTDKERESLQREKCEVEKLKRSLRDEERKLRMKENELEELMREAEVKRNEGERAIFEAKSIETKYGERMRDLQTQLGSLSQRERKLAEEKISLSRERLALNTLIRQNKKCGLCSVEPDKNENIPSYLSRFDGVDEDIVRLRLEVEDEVPK